MDNRLLNIANHLLDLGKRNRLLNFKESGLRSINILNENKNEIFSGITNSKTYSFLMLDPILTKYHKDLILNPEDDDVLNYSDLKVKDIALNLLKNNQLLAYNRGYTLLKSLNALQKEYKYSITEKGINSLYLSFGFIKYTEDNIKYLAPLMLIPVELSLDKGIYKIKEYDDEVIINPTLVYYLKNFYKYDLVLYEDETLDDYVNKLKASLISDLEYVDGMAIGIYSFLKMNMYSDLINNSDIVLQNKNIRALLGGKYFFDGCDNPIYPVVDCDSTQLEAIKLASSGKSFTLQGPPGSGKSQTITNIISTLIGNGKHVLFVSEKLAALNVVYDNLKRAGLSEFAIEIHSNKANKKSFIDNLYKTAILPKYDISIKSSEDEVKYKIVSDNLESYYEDVNRVVDGYSLYDLISMYNFVDCDVLNYKLTNVSDINYLNEVYQALKDYTGLTNNDYRKSAFYGIKDMELSYIKYELKNEFKAALIYLGKLNDLSDNLAKHKIMALSVNDVYNSLDFIEHLVRIKNYIPAFGVKAYRDELKKLLSEYKSLKLKSSVMNNYNNNVIKENLNDIYNIINSTKGISKLFNKKYKNSKKLILSFRNKKCDDKVLISEILELINLKKSLIKATNISKEISKYTSSKNYTELIKDLKLIENDNSFEMTIDEYNELKPYFTDLLITFDSMRSDDLLLRKISARFDLDIFDIYNTLIKDVRDKLNGIVLNLENINTYNVVLNCVDKIKKLNGLDFLHFYLDNNYELNKMPDSYKKLYLDNIILTRIKSSLRLSSFTTLNEINTVNDFIKLDSMILILNRDKIISYNSKKRPDDVLIEGSKFKILAHEANKLRKQKPIRELLDEIFELAVDIKPVFLMSPLSVSTYLSSRNDLFDCVIFDEASQIFAWDSLGAIYRSKQCIIIGDNKQMPPSNFFGAQAEDDSDDLESILDLGSTSFLSSGLKWHYRSRSEELITFSNKEFYDNSLITIPQARKHSEGFGVDFYYVCDGRYDMKTRTNRIEAQKICDMVVKHLKTSNESLGVVAFSNSQATLIEDLINDRINSDNELKKIIEENTLEPFFVKNLETVQGDERDRIIFSICYGYNDDNKFYQRFGPLNNLGGERRLNVAITRAKYNVSVVSSIKSVDIRCDASSSRGVKLLHDYLEYASNAQSLKCYSESNDATLNKIKDYVISLGYDALPNYGSSAFKIDLAVKQNDEFIMAIVLDKRLDYKSNTTDRERLKEILLKRAGWNYYKTYSVAWFLNEASEREKLKDAILSNSNVLSDKLCDKATSDISYLDQSDDNSLESKMVNYEMIDINEGKEILNNSGIRELISRIVYIEQPIHENRLFKRVAQVLGAPRITNVIKNQVKANLNEDICKNGQFYYIDKQSSKLRINSDREFDEIPLEEIEDGIYTIISENNGITIEGCFKMVVKLLGYSRVTDTTKKVLENALVFLKLDGKIVQRGDCLFK